MKIKKIAHVALAVADMEHTLSKLEQVLGMALFASFASFTTKSSSPSSAKVICASAETCAFQTSYCCSSTPGSR